MQDGETEVAAAAASALQCLADPADRLHQWLHPKSPSALLASALSHQDATVRSRALSLTVNLAASSPDAAQTVLSSGTQPTKPYIVKWLQLSVQRDENNAHKTNLQRML